MKFSAKVLLAVVALAATSFTAQACDDHDHDPVIQSVPNGISYEMHGRRMVEQFRVDGTDYGTRAGFIRAGKRCGTADATPRERREAAMRLADWKARNGGRRLQADPINIPVYMHVIRNGDQGGVTVTQQFQQIQVLNDSFAPDFSFSVEGIDETDNAAWFGANVNSNAELDMKTALHRGESDALNFYFTQSSDNSLGWATLPLGVNNNAASLLDDGVVLRFDTVPGGAFSPFNEGDTAVHETGHWLGLFHTFDNGCNEPGDSISDTPAEASPASGCPVGRDTCAGGGEDPIFNFMDYSDDSCMNTFTDGQVERMLAEYDLYRLRTDENGNPIVNPGNQPATTPQPTQQPQDAPTRQPQDAPTQQPQDAPTPTAPTPAPPTPAPPTPAPPTPAPPTPAPPTPAPPTPAPPTPAPPTPTAPTPTIVFDGSGGGVIIVKEPTNTVVVQNSRPTSSVVLVQNSAQATCSGLKLDGRRCQRNYQCCSGSCSNRVCVPV